MGTPQPTRCPPPSGSSRFDVDEICDEYIEIDVCADEDFWWDEEDRHEL